MSQRPTDRYTHGHHAAVLASHRARTAENSAAYLLPHLVSGQQLLDVGCGPGTITLDLAARVAPGAVVALDREPAVLAEVERLASERGATNVSTTTGDVYALDFADGAFDVVHAHQVLQHLSDPIAALREMRRVTRPGGVVAVRDADYAAMTWYPAEPRLDRWLELYRQVARSNGAEPDAGRRLLAWTRAAGFSEIDPQRLSLGLRRRAQPRVVGPNVGRTHAALGPGGAGPGHGPGQPRGARGGGCRLARVAGPARCLVQRPPRRDRGPTLARPGRACARAQLLMERYLRTPRGAKMASSTTIQPMVTSTG